MVLGGDRIAAIVGNGALKGACAQMFRREGLVTLRYPEMMFHTNERREPSARGLERNGGLDAESPRLPYSTSRMCELDSN